MITKLDRNKVRQKRHARIRNKISGTASRPRLSVFRSNANISAQLIDDVAGVTLVSASSLDLKLENGSNVAAAIAVGTETAGVDDQQCGCGRGVGGWAAVVVS